MECMTDFKYLGSIVEAKGGVEKEVCERIAVASLHLVFYESQCSETGTCPSPPKG